MTLDPQPQSQTQPLTHPTQSRKADHIRICLEDPVHCETVTTGLERYRFRHCCLPELDRADLDLTTPFFGKTLGAPLLISSMTGGTEQARQINQRLAAVAQQYGLAMGVGSQRVALERPEVIPTFAVRNQAPDILLLANVGAVQLNYGYGVAECQRLVEMLEADALILHLNPLQEWIQPQGDTNFRDLLAHIAVLCQHLPVPVIAKEVGNGITGAMAQRLIEAGVAAIDVAGAGGTSWAKVESARAQTALQRRLGTLFGDWGIPTAQCVREVRSIAPAIPLIASGGLQNGLDIAKALALGANLAGIARPLLKAATESEARVQEEVEALLAELSTVLFCTGVARAQDLAIARVLEPLESPQPWE
ncbi:MAG: type 2 isopentenyl-diphosphate Delta-isomerase [Prochlorothrix sp.]|nr:type 2 isopentenyl-diphosphate Delta-isomerase [Prochlorothrix sp.]